MFTWGDVERTQDEIARISPADATAYLNYANFWQRAGDLFEPYLLTDPPTISQFVTASEGSGNEALAQMLIAGNKRQLLNDFFESPRVKASLGTTFDGGYTDNAGSLLYFAFAASLTSQLGRRGLVGFAQGGMGAVTKLLQRAAESVGAEIRTSTTVAKIHVADGRTRGIVLPDGTIITASTVLANADPHRTLSKLVPADHIPHALKRSLSRLRINAGYLKLHCATTGLPEWRALPGDGPQHGANVRLCESLEQIDRAWDEAQSGQMPSAPILGVVCPSVYDRSVVPPGHHTISIWVEYAPVGLSESDWISQRTTITDGLIDQVARYAPNFPSIVSNTHLHGPPEIETRAGMTRGNMHHVDMTVDQMLGDRPMPECSAYRTPLGGLYFCGAGCHPGGGVTGVPGHNAAQTVIHDLNVTTTPRTTRATIFPRSRRDTDGMRGRSQ